MEVIWGNDENHTLLGIMDLRRTRYEAGELDSIIQKISALMRAEELKEMERVVSRLVRMKVSDDDIRRTLNEALVRDVMDT